MKTILILLALMGQFDLQQAVVIITGASCVEDLSEEEISRFQSLADHPLDLNRAARSRLISSGLFSQYQVASIIDYRSRTGDILSWKELALVDGFSEELAQALRFFLVLDSNNAPGSKRSVRYGHTLTARGSINTRAEMPYRVKYQGSLGDIAELYLTTPGTASAAYYGRKYLGKVVAGHFNARFGQGLLQWSGFNMTSLSTTAAFSRKSSGFSPTGAASPDMLGIATDWNIGSWSIGAAYSFTGNQAVVNLSRYWRRHTLGMTATMQGASADWRFSLPATAICGEVAVDWKGQVKALASADYSPSYGSHVAMRINWQGLDTKEWSDVHIGFSNKDLNAIVSAGMKKDSQQYKALLTYSPQHKAGSWIIKPGTRLQARYMPQEKYPLRAEGRITMSAALGRWEINGRYDYVFCAGGAHLGYIEGAFKSSSVNVYLRGGLFMIDKWDDRIYVYERDVPGSFNVPAYYGRGWNASLYSGWKINRNHSLWLRLEIIDYPWNLQPKQGKATARLQYRWTI